MLRTQIVSVQIRPQPPLGDISSRTIYFRYGFPRQFGNSVKIAIFLCVAQLAGGKGLKILTESVRIRSQRPGNRHNEELWRQPQKNSKVWYWHESISKWVNCSSLCPNSPMAEALLSKSKCCEFESHFGHQNFGEVKREKIKWKRLGLYLLRWQMSSPILREGRRKFK